MSRIFITGATGYIGGDVLSTLARAFQASKISALVRSEARASLITDKFPSVTPVIGDLDSTAKISSEASEADVVLHLASSNHIASATAIAQGLAESKRQKPVWIQISGASLLSGPEIASKTYGEPSSKLYNDLQGVSDIRNIITSSPKRAVDNLILNLSSTQPHVCTAIVYAPLIYGQGKGPVNQRSIQVPDLARGTLRQKHGIQVGRGLSCWSNVHISDLAQLIVKLVVEAQREFDPVLWNGNGIYFAENGKMSFGEIATKIASFAHQRGFIKESTVKDINAEAADQLIPHGAVLWGTNAQYRAVRARQLLGWQPQGSSLEEEIPRAVSVEASSGSRL